MLSSSPQFQRAALLWTGGKDCTLALYRAQEAGIAVSCLVTFVPAEGTFKAHPQGQIERQAKELGLQLHFLTVKAPYRQGYISHLAQLKSSTGINAVVTGDIDFVEGHPNWIAQCCTEAGLEVILPLWQMPRLELLRELIDRKIEARLNHINHPAIPSSWLGRSLDDGLLTDLIELSKRTDIDPCGENGEYHTMVTGFPALLSK